ncbi:MAG TPA: hypothetical protein VNT54_12760 [Solirubrobacteraceae bacterium]|nr:hypothetical protein [Solirubrobacteraceae bacterium]
MTAAAGLENLARTTGDGRGALAAFPASAGGEYLSGCRFGLR